MPRFYTHIRSASTAGHYDSRGEEAGDLKEMRKRALLSARRLMAHLVLQGIEPDFTDELIVEDCQGKILLTLRFADALRGRSTGRGGANPLSGPIAMAAE